jgi:ankyrin repeat domain-containing protein 17
VVQLLLDWGARPQYDSMKVAAKRGYLGLVELLLAHHCATQGALAAAARGGYGDVVKVLLEHGANANDNDNDGHLCVICHAAIMEHTSIFQNLIEHGALAPSVVMRIKCERRAKRRRALGRSMIAILDF